MDVSNLAVQPQASHLVDQFPTLGPEPPLTLPITPASETVLGPEKVLNKHPEA